MRKLNLISLLINNSQFSCFYFFGVVVGINNYESLNDAYYYYIIIICFLITAVERRRRIEEEVIFF